MTDAIEKVKYGVIKLLSGDIPGHGGDHILRVYTLAAQLNEKEKADKEIVSLAALLHDCDDYKFFGKENAQQLTNAKKIMQEAKIPFRTQESVCTIIRTMGYSNLLKGIRPQSLEGKIVSDADMLDAIGAIGTIRCLSYSLHKYGCLYFDKNIWPEVEISSDAYKSPNRKSDNFINHFFEKLLKLKNLMLTETGKKEAQKRHFFMVSFLRHFFEENQVPEWQNFLEKFLKENNLSI